MRYALLITLTLSAAAFAQSPPVPPTPPRSLPPGLGSPRRLPPGVTDLTKDEAPTTGDRTVKLPEPEEWQAINIAMVRPRQVQGGWQVVAGAGVIAEFGPDARSAEESARVLRELRPTQWATVGGDRPVVGYGLFNGTTRLHSPQPKLAAVVDITSVRAEQVRGVWVVKDDAALHLNCGTRRGDAEMAAAVARRYGYNRIGHVGTPGQPPLFSYYFAESGDANNGGFGALSLAAAEMSLQRTGVPVPGLGYVGEMVQFDPRKLETRREGGAYVLAHGPDVFARFGGSELAARDALRLCQECRFTEFCRVGDLTFFLVRGQAPTKVPFNTQGRHIDPKGVKARTNPDGTFAVVESTGRLITPAATAQDAERMAGTIRGFGFDTVCQLGLSPSSSLRFLAKTGGR